MGIDIVIRCERGDMVIRLENIGYENSVSPRLWVGLLAIFLGAGYLSSGCDFDPECLGRTFHSSGCFSLWNTLGNNATLRDALLTLSQKVLIHTSYFLVP